MFNPFSVTGAVNDAKKNRSLGKSVVVNVVAGALLLVSLVIASLLPAPANLPIAMVGSLLGLSGITAAVVLGIVGLVFLLVGELVLGWVYSLAVDVLGGKGSLYEGFTALTYPTYVLSIGWPVGLVVSAVPVVGPVLALLVGLIFGALSAATLFRVTKDLFALDYVATVLAVGVLGVAISVGLGFLGGSIIPQLSILTNLAGSLTGGAVGGA